MKRTGFWLILCAVVICFVPAQAQRCKSVGGLPDPKCTPGSTYAGITQENIKETICNPHWEGKNIFTGEPARGTKILRPPVSYTNKLKIIQMRDYGFTGSASDYEEDHLIPLELGGNPTDPKNLWPEPGAAPNAKDRIENLLHARVCRGEITLREAQREIASDWTKIR